MVRYFREESVLNVHHPAAMEGGFSKCRDAGQLMSTTCIKVRIEYEGIQHLSYREHTRCRPGEEQALLCLNGSEEEEWWTTAVEFLPEW